MNIYHDDVFPIFYKPLGLFRSVLVFLAEYSMVSLEQLKQILKNASIARLAAFQPFLDEAMNDFAINTARRAAAFIAQLAHESMEFRFMEEIWGPTDAQKRYEPVTTLSKRLGNTEPGDGRRFKGRGPLQITGRANYRFYGELLGLDLIGNPDQAATPNVGFRTAGLFWKKNGLNALADADDIHGITQRINGGQNGAAQREAFYALAKDVLAGSLPDIAPAGAAVDTTREKPFVRGAELMPRPSKSKRQPIASAQLDARPDTMDFRDTMYVPTLIEVPTHIPLGEYLAHNVPILDQGKEGACTGYGLATVANYLLLRRRVLPDSFPVSPRMLYEIARRYDEWPGEAYSGSSARGAMKGWNKHGVCTEDMWPSPIDRVDKNGLTHERTTDARRRPLGAYFRVNHKDLTAMHSAIAEVGILFATSAVHQGWRDVDASGEIVENPQIIGGHAFAIVAYDDHGFWLQNSWGPTWGRDGFARVSYDDWLRNGTDIWVARLGAPVKLKEAESTATAHATTSGRSAAYSFADLRPHIISVGDNGALNAGGDYGTTAEGLRHIFEEDVRRVTRGWPKVRILLYAHGGLVGEQSAVQRLAEYRARLLEAKVYPLAFIWHSDYWTTITNILRDAVRRRRPEGFLDAAKDFMLDRMDDALEPLARMFSGRSAWEEMKQNALAASNAKGAAHKVVEHLAALAGTNLELHLVGHSAGAIFHAPLVKLLADSGIGIESCTLWAPACTVELFRERYLPAITHGDIKRFSLFMLNDGAEQDDDCARIYNKSLLYLVSNAFESSFRIPGILPSRPVRDGVPILGMEKFLPVDVRNLLQSAPHKLVIAPNAQDIGSGFASEARHHGDFDDDKHTVASTFAGILGRAPGSASIESARMTFRSSGSALQDKRLNIDAQTTATRAR